MLCNFRSIITAVFLLCVALSSASAEEKNETGIWQPFNDVQFSESGDLAGWKISDESTGYSQLITDQKYLLSLQFYMAKNDVTKEFVWRQVPAGAEFIAKFMGTHPALGIEIQRSYARGEEIGTLVHSLTLSPNQQLPNEFQIKLSLLPNLRTHTSPDNYLSNLFYGHKRVFAIPGNDLESGYVQVSEPTQAFSAALAVRHFAVVMTPMAADNQGLTVDLDQGAVLIFNNQHLLSTNSQSIGVLKLSGKRLANSKFSSFLYSDALAPLRGIARLIEWSLQGLFTVFGNAGWAIILFAFLFRAVMLPISLWSSRQQQKFTKIQAIMKMQIAGIDKTLSGADKSEEIIKIYKELGISPFSGLKGSIGLFIQLPVLIALFSVTAESALFRNASFLWISDLSLPDRFWSLTNAIPGLGAEINLLPILLGVVSILAALIQSRGTGGSPLPGLILALVFVVFFYPCAAALVLYWLVVNCLQFFEGVYVSRAVAEPDRLSK